MNIATNPEVVEAAHQVIYLKDYTPPSYQVESINLTIQVFDDHALVHSKLILNRTEHGDLVLLGRDLELVEVKLNYLTLNADQYLLNKEELIILDAPDHAIVETTVKIHPETNTQLEGLYLAGGDLYVTQNEPEGFRKITFYPDRPDVLSIFTTRIEADKKYPTLLANGNLIEKGDLEENRHYTVWQDPTKKPSYLFAAVIGNLQVLKDTFTTSEGREVALEIYAIEQDIPKCHTAMQALKDSMKWDEEVYGRAYDLDNYMIVAVSQFNMGAMENKGLNIFNTACVLADPTVTTDIAIFNVKAVIAHEYFHNWTGNRITCRDWFQLCLKEGFTVFRDQSFSETLQSPAVQRIDDVSTLKSIQFAEDAGPLSHPPRPDHFVEINNFYTATVYEKGAEIARMIANLLGKEKFRQGTDEYFCRFDGQAVTVEDLLDALSDGSGVDVRHFLNWYSQPGTPTVSGEGKYDAVAKTYTLNLSQKTPKRPAYPEPVALPIPVGVALFDAQTGKQLTLSSQSLAQNQVEDGLVMLDQLQQQFVFENVATEPVISLLRNFSAPVILDFDYSDEQLAFLLAYETNGFNQWQAAQTLLDRVLLKDHDAGIYLKAIAKAIPAVGGQDALLASRLLEVPSENYIASRIDQGYDPVQVKQKRESLLNAVAVVLKDYWPAAYQALPIVAYQDNSVAMGERAFRNVILSFAFRAGIEQAIDWANQQYDQAVSMTERLGALRQLVWNNVVGAEDKLNDFYQKFKHEALALDQWFGVQAANPLASVAAVQSLTQLADFDWGTPNRIRSVTSYFASNPSAVWTENGIRFYAHIAQVLDEKNPILGSRVLQSLTRWYTLVEPSREQAKAVLQSLAQTIKSSSVGETLSNLLKADQS